MKIGITERGDAGIDLSWSSRLNDVDGAILITKSVNMNFINEVLKATKPLIIHATCTGYGGTEMEPYVPSVREQINGICTLIESGFNPHNIVFRIDPIFPTDKGIMKFHEVMAEYLKYLYPKGVDRVRISVLDEYAHVRKRFEDHGWGSIYNGSMTAHVYQIHALCRALFAYQINFETCAEPSIDTAGMNILRVGCVSVKDICIMGLREKYDGSSSVNPQNRNGCLCLSCKTELLKNKHRCPHQCVYCYWKDK